MKILFNILRKVLKPLGLTIKRIQPAVSKDQDSLYGFFVENPNESEVFMQYVYSLIVKQGDTVVDVGANHGLHTIPLSRLAGEKGQVIAFEAVPDLIADIKGRLISKNVKLINAAVTKPEVAKQSSIIQFMFYPNRDGYSSLKPESLEDGKLISVKATTLDQAISENNIPANKNISFIKMDVEGGDFDALLGAEKTLKKYKPVVIMENKQQESADQYGYSKNDYFNYVEGLGYKLFQFTGKPYTKKDWNAEGVYWETWLVHKDSPMLEFFNNHCENLASTFIGDRLA